jgi:hypothetical protein
MGRRIHGLTQSNATVVARTTTRHCREGSLPRSTGAISGRARSCLQVGQTRCCQQLCCPVISLRLQVRLIDALHAGRLACMDSPLGAPGGLGGTLLVQHGFEV